MKHTSIYLWYPSQRINLGILSKSLRSKITSIAKGVEIDITATHFEDSETFILECIYESAENLKYLINTLHRMFGKIQAFEELKLGNILRGRLLNPGAVGFGIFVDIGIRPEKDVLFNLINLRELLVNSNKVSNRKIVNAYGFIDGFPMEFTIKNLDKSKNRVNVILSSNYSQMLEEWRNTDLQRLIITKYLNYNIEALIKKLGIGKFIEEIEAIDPLTTIIICKKRTNANGLLPILGPEIGSSPMGIFNPEKIAQLL